MSSSKSETTDLADSSPVAGRQSPEAPFTMKRRANFPDGPIQNKKAKPDDAELDADLHVDGAEVNSSNEGNRSGLPNKAEEGGPIDASELSDEEEKVQSSSPEVSGPATSRKPKSWNDMPRELRDIVYRYVLMDAWKTRVTVKHFPDGRPKFSSESEDKETDTEDGDTPSDDLDANFAYSSWGFTQTCKQIKKELRPQLIRARNVQTTLWTLKEYIETFHPPGKKGRRFGFIYLISEAEAQDDGETVYYPGDGNREYKEALYGRSVDLLPLLKLFHNHKHLHVCQSDAYSRIRKYQEHTMEREMLFHLMKNYDDFMDDAVGRAGIESIDLSLAFTGRNDEEHDPHDHDIVISLGIGEPKDRPLSISRQISEISKVLFESGIVRYAGEIAAEYGDHELCWVVLDSWEMELTWTRSSSNQTTEHRIHSGHASPRLQ
ncbi:hypothetical protein IQ07DRAFT_652487 [Pyrenochaeta sp. DS3sAY3a]|nr:hypothetical protein IQ07DRAFT_652487 [Pyrenochaeta sp. DS3sAY3a]